MEQALMIAASTVLAAKMLADTLRREYGFVMGSIVAGARTPSQIDIAYVIALAACLLVVGQTGVEAGLLFAILMRVGYIVSGRILLPGNHSYLELLVALTCVRLLEEPGVLAGVLQIITVSVWVYAAFQKLYHREFLDGSFFYLHFQNHGGMKNAKWWASFIPKIPPVRAYSAAINPAGQAFCRRLAVQAVALELVVPLVAFATNGTIWGFALLMCVSLPVGVLTGETNFMITNILLGLVFLVPFDASTLPTIVGDPVVLGIVVWCLIWPPVHAVLTRRYRVSPWKLAGWGMYATQNPRVDVVHLKGSSVAFRSDVPAPFSVLKVCGACRIPWLRAYASRSFFRWCDKEAVSGLLFRWYRRRGDRYVTECVWLPNTRDATPRMFTISDEHGETELGRFLLTTAPNDAPVRSVAQANAHA